MKCFVLLFFCLIMSFSYGQQVDYVDFIKADVHVSFTLDSAKVIGSVRYEFKILKQVDSIFMDAVEMKFSNVRLNRKPVKHRNDLKKIWIKTRFKAGDSYEVRFDFEVSPKQAMYFIDWDYTNVNKQIWTQGQGKYTSHWLPSIDDMNDKIEFDLSIEFDSSYQVIANGKLLNKETNLSTTTWYFDMQKPMSSYLVALAIGKYDKKTQFSKSSIPLEMYYYPEDSLKFEPTYRYTSQMFDFFEEEIGVPYPWQNYKQVPVKDFLYAGMENTTTTIFSDSFVIDNTAFMDKNYVNVNAHELAHQWFGNLVTETSGTHHWLHEGFATYYALLAEKDIFGNDYYYWQLYQYAQELLEQDNAGESTSLLDPKSSSITFYKKGALVLHILREQVGEIAFKKAVKTYLLKHQLKNVENDDFITEIEQASRQNLSEFVKTWLENHTFEYDKVLSSLEKSKFIKEYLEIDCEEENKECQAYLSSSISDEAKIKVISQNPKLIKNKDFTNSLKVRQAIALYLNDIPASLKSDYETLLEDLSYITIEKALFHLWINFPQERHTYLNKIKAVDGFNDKNVRTLWLTLVLITEDFEPANKPMYFEELISYTSPKNSFELRQNAFLYLREIQACNDVCVENLKQATTHHSWQFSKFAKALLEQFNIK